jgi:hypothetical protein
MSKYISFHYPMSIKIKAFLLSSVKNEDKLYNHIKCLGQYQIIPLLVQYRVALFLP